MTHENAVITAIIFLATLITAYLVKKYLDRTIGTNYRTQSQCDECSVRQSMTVIRTLVVELAIKAGVPAHEVAKIVGQIGGLDGGRRCYDPNERPK